MRFIAMMIGFSILLMCAWYGGAELLKRWKPNLDDEKDDSR